ncbi:MAG: hemin uptake protein HemP [Chromatiaceae bacterium]|nr:hemin uptake protein HemP [Chromatiaceae bacterium]MCP5313898.1 hemin uptake protein HemP [Chromatiaceae bacterium]
MNVEKPNPHAVDDAAPSALSSPKQARIDSRSLFGDRKLVLIDHHGETYTLRLTRQGKLILTK